MKCSDLHMEFHSSIHDLSIFLPFCVARFLLLRIISLAGSVLECGLFETSKGGIKHTAYTVQSTINRPVYLDNGAKSTVHIHHI